MNFRFHHIVRLIRAGLGVDRPQPLAHPEYMRIDRHRRHPQGKVEDNPRRFRPNARQLPQPRFGLRQRHFPQKRQVQRPAVQCQHLPQNFLDPRRLDLRQPAGRNRALNRRHLRPSHRLQRPKPLHQPGVSPPGVNVRRMLRQYRKHHLIRRRQSPLLLKRAIFPRHQSHRFGHPRGRHRRATPRLPVRKFS